MTNTTYNKTELSLFTSRRDFRRWPVASQLLRSQPAASAKYTRYPLGLGNMRAPAFAPLPVFGRNTGRVRRAARCSCCRQICLTTLSACGLGHIQPETHRARKASALLLLLPAQRPHCISFARLGPSSRFKKKGKGGLIRRSLHLLEAPSVLHSWRPITY